MFSKSCEHGLRAIIYIATQSMEGHRVKIGDVATHTDSPLAFTAKIVGSLVKHELVQSLTGPQGGFLMHEHQMRQASVRQVVEAIDGNALFTRCALGLSQCNALRPCPMHHRFVGIRKEIREMLEGTTIFELATGLKDGASLLRN